MGGRRALAAVLLTLLGSLAPSTLHAQDAWQVPAYRPINPVLAARSAIGFTPWQRDAPGWQLGATAAYASSAEYYQHGQRLFILDAELYRIGLHATLDIPDRLFIRGDVAVAGMHAGFADAFFDGFHRMLRYEQNGREERPRNELAYVAVIDRDTLHFDTPSAAPGRAAITVGRRHTAWLQSTVTVDLPVKGSYAPARGALSTAHTARAQPHRRVSWETSAAASWAPRYGILSRWQRPLSIAFASGTTVQVAQRAALHGSIFYQSAPYHDTRIPLLDRGELSTAFGILLRTGAGRVWHIGLVEELRFDSGIDLVLEVGSFY